MQYFINFYLVNSWNFKHKILWIEVVHKINVYFALVTGSGAPLSHNTLVNLELYQLKELENFVVCMFVLSQYQSESSNIGRGKISCLCKEQIFCS